MFKLFLVGCAGFLGTTARYLLSGYMARRMGESFPAGTLTVNLLGCFLIGALFYLLQERFLVDPLIRSLIFLGFLGGFTTFSSFGLQTFTLLREGEIFLALVNIPLSNLGGLLMVWAGYVLSKILGGGTI